MPKPTKPFRHKPLMGVSIEPDNLAYVDELARTRAKARGYGRPNRSEALNSIVTAWRQSAGPVRRKERGGK